MRRTLPLLTTMAPVLLMVSSVAQTASPKVMCQQEAESLTGLNLTGYNFIVGNNRRADDFSSKATAGADVFCGRGGNELINTLDAADIFIGGAGFDQVAANNGTFYGGANNDFVNNNYGLFVD